MPRQHIEPGLATGLAWTQVGGDIIFIEVAIMPGSQAESPLPANWVK